MAESNILSDRLAAQVTQVCCCGLVSMLSLSVQLRAVSGRFRARRQAAWESLGQPPSPTRQQLEQLELEVEQNLRTKLLIQDDFSEPRPAAGRSLAGRLRERLLDGAIHPQSTGLTCWCTTQNMQDIHIAE